MNCGPRINLPVTSRSSLDTPPGPVEPPPTSRLGVPRSCSLEGDCISRICDWLPLAYSPPSLSLVKLALSRLSSHPRAGQALSHLSDHHLGQALIVPRPGQALNLTVISVPDHQTPKLRSASRIPVKPQLEALYVSNVNFVPAYSGVCMEALDQPASTTLTVTGQPCIPVKHLT